MGRKLCIQSGIGNFLNCLGDTIVVLMGLNINWLGSVSLLLLGGTFIAFLSSKVDKTLIKTKIIRSFLWLICSTLSLLHLSRHFSFLLGPTDGPTVGWWLCCQKWTYQYMQYNIYCISGRQTRCNIVVIVWDVIEYYTKNINRGANITNSVLIRLAMHRL